MNSFVAKRSTHLIIALFTFAVFSLPFSAEAASSKPTCSVSATTDEGTVDMRDGDTVLLKKGEDIKIAWESNNAKKAFDKSGDAIDLDGSATVSPSKTSKYEYTFKNGTRKAECEITVRVVTGSFAKTAYATNSTKPTITGKAEGTKSVQIEVRKKDSSKVFFTSKNVKVRNGKWDTAVTKKLPKGEYELTLLGTKGDKLRTIATTSLYIGIPPKTAVQKQPTKVVVEVVPLLAGGIVRNGATVPISYLQVINIGSVPATVKSFKVQQNGSASAGLITALSVSDESGLLQSAVGTALGTLQFKNNIATLPTDFTIGAGEMKLFTLKATVSNTAGLSLGKQFKLDVAAVETNATGISTFPLRGTTWTIGY